MHDEHTGIGAVTVPPMHAAPPGTCLNCGAPLTGRFCARCGQEDEPIDAPIRTIAAEAIGSLFNWDGRGWRSFRALLFRPGRLTAEWSAGRRVRWLPPIRIYIIASLFFLAVVSLFGDGMVVSFGPEQERRVGVSVREDPAADAVVNPEDIDAVRSWRIPFADRFASGLERALREPDWMEERFLRNWAWTMFLVMPVFALLLALLERKPRRRLVHHLVFAVHLHAFAFAVFGILATLSALTDRQLVRVLAFALLLALPLYLALALRTVYRRSWWRVLPETVALGVMHVLIVSVFATGATFITVILAGS